MLRTAHTIIRLPLLGGMLLILLLLLPSVATAASYWVHLSAARGEIAPGVNSFVVQSHGGAWNSYGNHCQAEAGSYVAGAYCRLRFNVPPGLTAGAVGGGGIARGDFRTANVNFILRSERPGGNPAGVTDSNGDGAFNHGWQVLGPYVDIGLRVMNAATTTSATNWFHIDTFDVLLHDPSSPAIQHVHAGSGGWNGPGCLPHSYSWADTGSQISSMSVTDLATGTLVDSWSVNATGVVSGHGAPTDTGCTPAPGTGSWQYRTVATDRAGNSSSHVYSLSFDTTPPAIAPPHLDGQPLFDGAVIDSRHGYRPGVTWSGVGDAHSGIASVVTTVGGARVAHVRSGATVTLAPEANLPLGTHQLAITVTDAVGNRSIVSRRIVVRDDVAPTLRVASPEPSGGSEPVLDISASDDYSGLVPSSWTVKVNGATLVASSQGHRLQADVGYLIDGTHEIVVTVADHAGNVGRATIEYDADSGDELPDAPSLSGIFVFDSPSIVVSGSTHRVRALVVKAGRPVEGTVELRKGPLVLASGSIAPNGSLDLAARISVSGPLSLHPPAGSGLSPVELDYEFREEEAVDPAPVACEPPLVLSEGACRQPAGGAGSAQPTSTTTNNMTHIHNPPAAAGAGGAAGEPGAAAGGFPHNVVYYVGNVPFWNGLPLAESGAPLDRVAPRWRLSLIQHRAGTVKRTRRIALRLWTTEMAVMRFEPRGSVRRTTISPRRQQRTVLLAIARESKLGRTIARARRGSVVTVRIRIVATDKNENRSLARTRTFRVRV